MIGNYYLLVEIVNPYTPGAYLKIKARDLYEAMYNGTAFPVLFERGKDTDGTFSCSFDLSITTATYSPTNSSYVFSGDSFSYAAENGDEYPTKKDK